MDGKVRLSRAGQIAKEQWQKTARLRPNVLLDEWIVMPNHIHGIVVIEDMEARSAAEVPHLPTETPQRGVSTRSASRRWTPGSLGAIINQFKGACTKRIRAASLGEFAWQPRFYDHIIRNERSLRDIRQYIRDNPLKWESDQYYV